jgi:hypothetical protein
MVWELHNWTILSWHPVVAGLEPSIPGLLVKNTATVLVLLAKNLLTKQQATDSPLRICIVQDESCLIGSGIMGPFCPRFG